MASLQPIVSRAGEKIGQGNPTLSNNQRPNAPEFTGKGSQPLGGGEAGAAFHLDGKDSTAIAQHEIHLVWLLRQY